MGANKRANNPGMSYKDASHFPDMKYAPQAGMAIEEGGGGGSGLSSREQRVVREIASRAEALLADVQLHVNLPTGPGGNTAIDETRERLCSRLKALGASVELVPGDSKEAWLSSDRDAVGKNV